MEARFQRLIVVGLIPCCIFLLTANVEARQLPNAPAIESHYQHVAPQSDPIGETSKSQFLLANHYEATNQPPTTRQFQPVVNQTLHQQQIAANVTSSGNTSASSIPATGQPAQAGMAYQLASQNSQYPSDNVDPIGALQEQVYSLQCQIDALNCSDRCNELDSQCRAGGLYFGAGTIFTKPHLKEAFQYSQINFAAGQQTLVPFGYDYQSTLRGWIGYRSREGFGFKVTYWGFDDEGRTSVNTADGMNIYGASAVTVIFPANIFAIAAGETLTNTDFLKTQIINYYGNYATRVGSFDLEGSLGLRYVRLLQSLDSFVTPAAGGAPTRRLSWQRNYDGLGPAISVDVKRRMGSSRFSIVGQGGGALLFGDKTIDRLVIGDQSPQPATRALVLEEADEVVGIGEMNFGVEWAYRFRGGRTFNIRGLYEGQLWAEAGAPTIGFLGFEGFGLQAELTR